MKLMNLFGLWMMLISAWETNVSVFGDSRVHCDVPSATAGQPTTLTCYFQRDVKNEKTDVVIQHSNKQGKLSEIVSCLWLTSERPTCTTDPGYVIEGKFSSNLTVRIHSTTEHHEGIFLCLPVPSDLSVSKPCNFTLRVAIFKETTERTVYSVPTTEQKNITTDDEQEGKDVNLIAIAISVAIILMLIILCVIVVITKCGPKRSWIREDNVSIEAHPLVSSRSPQVISTKATESSGKDVRTGLSDDETIMAKFCEFTQDELFGKFVKYIYKRTVQLLQKTGAVVITGPERCGKSTLGRAVLDHFSTMGFYPLLLDHPNLWWEKKHDDRKHVVLLDECKLDEWSLKTVKSMLQDDQCYILFVLKSDVMNSDVSGLPTLLNGVPTVGLGKKVPTDAGQILFDACKRGTLEEVITILIGGVDPNGTNTEGKTPLHTACEHGQADIVSQLLLAECDVNCEDKALRTPLHYACKGLEQDSGADAVSDDEDLCSRPESYDTPRETIVKDLLASGARVEAADKQGRTPLHLACEGRSHALVNILLGANASVEAMTNDSKTPLHLACEGSNSALVITLLEAGANVMAKDKTENTPLHMAYDAECKEIVDLLLAKGADIKAMNKKGETPKSIEKSKRRQNTAKTVSPKQAQA